MEQTIKIAIQKSGRLYEGSIEIIKECGISISRNRKEKLKATATNFPAEILFLRDDDIPQYVEDGVADIGIVGENVVVEKNKKTKIIERLGFSRCRLSLAIPKAVDYQDKGYFNGKRIATSYPHLLQQYLNSNDIDAEIHEISGSVEIAPGIGLADAICDLVSSGGTLFSNGLKEVETIFRSEAVIIANPQLSHDKKLVIEQLLFRIQSVLRAKKTKYILLNTPNDKIDQITALLPGMKSPTIMPLVEEGWSSLHSVVYEDQFWEVIDKLKEFGAQGILVMPIEKMF